MIKLGDHLFSTTMQNANKYDEFLKNDTNLFDACLLSTLTRPPHCQIQKINLQRQKKSSIKNSKN